MVKEDDLEKMEDDPETQKEGKCEGDKSGRQTPPRMVRKTESRDTPATPPPLRHGCSHNDGGGVPDGAGRSPSMCMDGGMATRGHSCVPNSTGVTDTNDDIRRSPFR